MKILIIEDEEKTRNYLIRGLSEQGYVVDFAVNGEDGLFFAKEYHYDLLILDVMLPKLDGWQVAELYRQHDEQTPILFLTAKDEVHDRIKGFSLGADDYLIKPFSFLELLARVKSLLKRGQIKPIICIIIADLVIDIQTQKVKRNNQYINLTQKEFTLLSLLARNQGMPLSRTQISEQVWDMNFDSDTNVVDVAIRRLRKKIDENHNNKLIHTIRGVGYVIEERNINAYA